MLTSIITVLLIGVIWTFLYEHRLYKQLNNWPDSDS